MKNTSNQKPTQKVKPTKKSNTASMLSARENQAVDSTPKQKRRSKFERRSSRFNTTFTVIVVIIILCAMLFFAVRSSTATQADMQRFVDLSQTVSSIRDQLNAASSENTQWLQTDKCNYWTLEDWSSGWNCSAGVLLEIDPDEVDIQGLIAVFDKTLISSDDIRFDREDSTVVDSQGYDYRPKKYIVKDTGIVCDAGLINHVGEDSVNTLKFSFFCESGAQKSWYPNSEAVKDESLRPGVNAWKSIK